MQTPKTIIVMCRANVGRSPFFGYLLSELLSGTNIHVFSRGIEEPKAEPYKTTKEASIPTKEMVANLARSGYRGLSNAQLTAISNGLNSHRSQIVTASELQNASLILTMEPELNQKMLVMFGSVPKLREKLYSIPEFVTRKVYSLRRPISNRGKIIKDPLFIDKASGKKLEVPVSKDRMDMHSQQVRLAIEIANHFTEKRPTYKTRLVQQRKLVLQKKEKARQRKQSLSQIRKK